MLASWGSGLSGLESVGGIGDLAEWEGSWRHEERLTQWGGKLEQLADMGELVGGRAFGMMREGLARMESGWWAMGRLHPPHAHQSFQRLTGMMVGLADMGVAGRTAVGHGSERGGVV